MGRHQGGYKGYEFSRQDCAGCGKSVAVSIDPDGRTVWLRRHHAAGQKVPCTHPRHQPRIDTGGARL